MNKLKMSYKQAKWMMDLKYRNTNVRDSLLSLEELNNDIIYYKYVSRIHEIRISSLGFFILFGFCFIVGLFINFVLIFEVKDNIIDGLIIANCLVLPLAIFGILYILLAYSFLYFGKLNKLKNDKILKIQDKPINLSIKCKIKYSGYGGTYSEEIIALVFTFNSNNQKLKIQYLMEPYFYIFSNKENGSLIKQKKAIKKFFINKKIDLQYFSDSKFVDITTINFESIINRIIKKKKDQ